MSEHVVIENFRLWLRAGLTGCTFAKHFASSADRVALELHVETELPGTEWVNRTFDTHADANRAVIAIFPQITNERRLVELLNVLGRDRWRVRRLSKSSPGGDILIGLEWRTKSNNVSEAMGLAPFSAMPVTRRSPYVAIATWPGGRANPFRGQSSTPPGRPGIVSFLDASHGFEIDAYEARWVKTTNQVTRMMSVPPDDAKLYRRAAFVLAPEVAAHVVFDPA